MVDTNVIIDVLRRREPHYGHARMLAALGYLGEFELWFSAAQATDVIYVLTGGGKRSEAERGKDSLRALRSFAHVCSVGETELDWAMESSWEDLEDALVYRCACVIKADAIVTRNKRDFARSSIPVYGCDELLSYLEKTRGIHYAEIELS